MPVESPSPVEFISAVNINPSNELNRLNQAEIDLPFFRRYVNALEDAGFDYTLTAYASAFQDQFAIANQIVARSERVAPMVALRPNTIYPTVAAKALATLDQFGQGRVAVHFISGGNDAEQAREGDYLTKQQRYARTAEYIDIVRQVWTSTEPFSHEGEFYKFDNFVSLVRPVRGTIPVSVGGSSADAYQVGGSRGDIFGLWGEPLADTRQQIDASTPRRPRPGAPIARASGSRSGRSSPRPRNWPGKRPGTRCRCWRAQALGTRGSAAPWGATPRRTSARSGCSRSPPARTSTTARCGRPPLRPPGRPAPRRPWSGRRRRWPPRSSTTSISAPSLVSIRGYDNLNDLIDYGRYILPLVRQELAHREATGQRGSLQHDYPGASATTAPLPERTSA